MFISKLHHIPNNYVSQANGQIKKCKDEQLTGEEIKKKLWISKNSNSYLTLKIIITAKDILKDLQQSKHCIHTGCIEFYHNVRLKYIPKRIHLKYEWMYIRSIVAILDHNNNTGKR